MAIGIKQFVGSGRIPPNPSDLDELLRAELKPGESLQWTCRESRKRRAWKMVPAVWFGIPWTAFSIYFVAALSGFKMPDLTRVSALFPLLGIPFVLVGFCLLSAPYWASKMTDSVYAITNTRALIVRSLLSQRVSIRSFPPAELKGTRCVEKRDGSGDLILESRVFLDGGGAGMTTGVGFFGIPQVRAVEQMVKLLGDDPSAAHRRA